MYTYKLTILAKANNIRLYDKNLCPGYIRGNRIEAILITDRDFFATNLSIRIILINFM